MSNFYAHQYSAGNTPTPNPEPKKKSNLGMFLALVGGGLFVLALLCGGVILAVGMPMFRKGSDRIAVRQNLKKISLAILDYESAYKEFPPRIVKDANGNALYSWRVLVLPFMEEKALYEEFHLDEPWDSPHNSKLLSRMPSAFSSSTVSAKSPSDTSIVAMAGFGGILEPPTNKLSGVGDGTNNTIGLIQTFNAGIPWTAPKDPSMNDLVAAKNSCPEGAFLVATCGTKVVLISRELPDEDYIGALHKNDGFSPRLEE